MKAMKRWAIGFGIAAVIGLIGAFILPIIDGNILRKAIFFIHVLAILGLIGLALGYQTKVQELGRLANSTFHIAALNREGE